MFCELKNYIQAVFLFLYCAVVSAQSDTLPGTHSAPLWYKKYLRESAYLQGRSLQDIGSIKAHKWEFIGPAIQPTELNPGGRAVPAYAVNRGNGTGRINYIYVHPKLTERYGHARQLVVFGLQRMVVNCGKKEERMHYQYPVHPVLQ
jgi:hypothetical protein